MVIGPTRAWIPRASYSEYPERLTHVDQPLLKVAETIEKAAEKDEYFLFGGCIPMLTFMGTSCSLGCEYKLLWIHCLELSDELLFQRL